MRVKLHSQLEWSYDGLANISSLVLFITLVWHLLEASGVAKVLGVAGQSGPLIALIGYLNVLLEYFDTSKFSLAGHNQHLDGPGPCLARLWLRPC